jgi:membrane protein YqaA with SNARE-associated domain
MPKGATQTEAQMFRRLKDWMLRWAGTPQAGKVLALVSFTESSVFPIPTEVLFIPMCIARPRRAYAFAAIATVTSVLGGFLGWTIGYYAFDLIAAPLLDFYGKRDAFNALLDSTADEAVLLMLITSGVAHLPPMKAVTIFSGLIGFNLWLFLLAALPVRALKFFGIAWAVNRYGEAIADVIERRFAWVAFGVIVALGLFWLGLKQLGFA